MTRRSIGALVLVLVPACVQVLGLEEAKLDEGGAGSAPPPATFRGINTHMNSCFAEPVPSCERCLQDSVECNSLPSCVGNADCRQELDQYAFCLGDACASEDWEDCSFGLSPDLEACVQSCGTECAGTRLTTECELYCACMSEICSDQDIGACMASCALLPTEVVDCRRNHCKSASHQEGAARETHCMHASDGNPTCSSNEQVSPAMRTTCTDGAESLWGCNEPDDCCSVQCNDGVCK